MVPLREKEKVKALIKETLMLLCKNGLSFTNNFTIEAVIGITVDEEDVLLVSMNELIKSDAEKEMPSLDETWSDNKVIDVLSSDLDISSDAHELETDKKTNVEERPAKRARSDGKCQGCDPNSNDSQCADSKHKHKKNLSDSLSDPDGIVIKQEIIDAEKWLVSGIQVDDPDDPGVLSHDLFNSPMESAGPNNTPQNSKETSSGKQQSNGKPRKRMGFTDTWSDWTPQSWSQTSQQTPYTCQTCGKSYKTKDYLQRHEKSHDSSLFMCKKCTQFFPNQQLYNIHIETKHGEMERKHICDICGKGFNRAQYLHRHIGMHEKKIVKNNMFSLSYNVTDQSVANDGGQESA